MARTLCCPRLEESSVLVLVSVVHQFCPGPLVSWFVLAASTLQWVSGDGGWVLDFHFFPHSFHLLVYYIVVGREVDAGPWHLLRERERE